MSGWRMQLDSQGQDVRVSGSGSELRMQHGCNGQVVSCSVSETDSGSACPGQGQGQGQGQDVWVSGYQRPIEGQGVQVRVRSGSD